MHKSLKVFALTSVSSFALAFNPNGKWKMDGDHLALDANGNPIMVLTDGTERVVQGDTIARLNGEAKQHRERAEAAEAAVQVFKDIDPAKAREAIEKLGKIDQKLLIDAGEIDKVRGEISQQYTAQIAEKDGALSKSQERINQLLIDREFGRSDFIASKIAVPREMFEATFGRNFKVENDKVIPYGADGNPIYSLKNAGEYAGVDEAFEILVERYPHKDQILRAPDMTGTGGSGNGGNRGGGRTMRRGEFEKLPAPQQAQIAQAAAKGEVKLVD
jgi:hypothetical protein